MDVNQAQELLEQKEKSQKQELEAHRVIEQDRLRQIKEKQAAEKEAKKKEIEIERKKYPKAQSKLHILKCWNCKEKNLNVDGGEIISKATSTLIVVTCPKCGCYNLYKIFNGSITSKHDKFLPSVDL